MTTTATEPVNMTAVHVLALARSLVLAGLLDPTTADTNGTLWAQATDEVARILAPSCVWPLDWRRDVDGAFAQLVETVADQSLLDDDPETYLDRRGLPRTTLQMESSRDLLATDRAHWLGCLSGLTR